LRPVRLERLDRRDPVPGAISATIVADAVGVVAGPATS